MLALYRAKHGSNQVLCLTVAGIGKEIKQWR
jgi:hypothetical protein